MCNGITKSGKPCSRKAEWCAQHINKKPAPVVEEHAPIRVYDIGSQACYPLSGEVYYVHSDDFDQTTLKSHHRFCIMQDSCSPYYDPSAESFITIDKVLIRDMKFYDIHMIKGYPSV